MAATIRHYKLNDFIRLDKRGELNLEESMSLVELLVTASAFNAESNILVDMRETTVKSIHLNEILLVATALAKHLTLKDKKIASLIPENSYDRQFIATQFKSAMNISGFRYEFFTKMDDAIEWLSEIKELGK